MSTKTLDRSIRVAVTAAVLIVLSVAANVASYGQNQQGGGTDIGGGFDIGGGGTTNTGGQATGGTGQTGGTGGTGGNVIGNDPIDLTQGIFELGQFTAERVQPFVGATSENVIHPRSNIAAGGGAGGAGSQFGGLNFLSGGRGGVNALGGGAGGFGLGTNTSVPRRGVRAAMRYEFSGVGSVLGERVVSNFADRIARTPAFNSVGDLNVAIENRVATLTGIVSSEQQKLLLERQLGLEPGVSSVDNQLQVVQSPN